MSKGSDNIYKSMNRVIYTLKVECSCLDNVK